MAIELTTVDADAFDPAADYVWFHDTSPAIDELNRTLGSDFFGGNLSQIRALADPNADRLLFWDDSAGAMAFLTLGTNLTITGTTLDASGGGLSGLGSVDNAIVRTDGTAGTAAQGSGAEVNDSGYLGVTGAAAVGSATLEVPVLYNKADTNTGIGLHGADIMSLIAGGYSIGFDGPNKTLQAGNDFKLGWSSSGAGAFGGGPDVTFQRAASNIIGIRDGTTGGGALSFVEMTAPAAPAANGCYLFVQDNGSGKSQIAARFATGAVQVIATEP